ncbi:hypothetical protein ANN_18230 [Periplaneta americana]|uniref:Uncharacterized protein n=1 Tax=Periplaneta americana TaxID=6978 RepID=A0ABQ8SN62_PERAM|nr:hypothetical protein ANN_18230 [Periplaneta americana]
MSPGSSTESYPAFARIGLRENPGKNLNEVTCPDRDSNPGHLVSQPDALTDKETKQYYQVEISNRFATLGSSDEVAKELDVNSVWENIRDSIKIAAEQSIRYYETKKKKSWLDEDCCMVVERRKQTSLKVEVFEKCVFPVLLYDCQTWSLNEKLKQMVKVCQRKMELKIMQVTVKDRIRNVDLRKNTGMKDAVQVEDELKWKWGGHVARLRDTQWTNRVTMWDPRIGKRSAGRQRTRRADTFTQRARKQWTSRARSRSKWRKLSKETSIGEK